MANQRGWREDEVRAYVERNVASFETTMRLCRSVPLRAVTEIINRRSDMRRVSAPETRFDDADLAAFVDAVGRHPSLTRLEVDSVRLESLIPALRLSTSIEHVVAMYGDYDDARRAMDTASTVCRTLETLKVIFMYNVQDEPPRPCVEMMHCRERRRRNEVAKRILVLCAHPALDEDGATRSSDRFGTCCITYKFLNLSCRRGRARPWSATWLARRAAERCAESRDTRF